MKQSRAASLVESMANIAVGFGLSCALQATILPAMGVPMPWSVNLTFGAVMTAVSVARQYGLRRVFEALRVRRAQALAAPGVSPPPLREGRVRKGGRNFGINIERCPPAPAAFNPPGR